MLEAKLACDSGCTWVCPPSACLSKTELGWATLATFWWQVAQWALEIPVQYPAVAPGNWEARDNRFECKPGHHPWHKGPVMIYVCRNYSLLITWLNQKETLLCLQNQNIYIFFPSSGSTAWLVTVMLVKYVGIASRKPEVLHRRPHCVS